MFENRRLLVETKVDSDEGGRWEAQADPSAWQTNRIAALAGDGDVCLFVTYGFSEFFTKWLDAGPAAAAAGFRHVMLDDMTALVEAATPLLADPAVDEWRAALRLERRKRLAMPSVLAAFAKFRRTYLDIGGEVDFSVTRIGVNAPEIAFPAFDQLLRAWGASAHVRRHGRLSLYPVSRWFVALPDSILNWWELLNWWEFWRSGDEITLGGLLPAGGRALYFEINEDFNLHLKLGAEFVEAAALTRAEAAGRLSQAEPTAGMVSSRPEFHQQGALAVWEWDLDLPALIARDAAVPATEALGVLLNNIVPRLV